MKKILATIVLAVLVLAPVPAQASVWHFPHTHKACKHPRHIFLLNPNGHGGQMVKMCAPIRGVR